MRSPVDPSQRPPAPGAHWRFWLMLVCLLLSLVWTLGSRLQGQVRNPNALPRPVTPREALKPEERATIALFRQASPSVQSVVPAKRRFAFADRKSSDLRHSEQIAQHSHHF